MVKIAIAPDGSLKSIYDDNLAGLATKLGGTISRASHVEPGPDNLWYADMSPRGGPTLGPFPDRKTAIAAETAWLDRYITGQPQ